MVAMPIPPSGQGSEAPGKPAKNRAMPATANAQEPATAIGTCASQGTVEASGTAKVPSMVTGATSGPATTLAGNEYTANWGCRATMTGPHKSCADNGTAIPAASHGGTQPGNQEAMRRASRMMPRVARTESRKPTLVPRKGSKKSKRMVAAHRKLSDRPRSPEESAATPTNPITAARSTLGSGPTRTTKAASPVAAMLAATGRGIRKLRAR